VAPSTNFNTNVQQDDCSYVRSAVRNNFYIHANGRSKLRAYSTPAFPFAPAALLVARLSQDAALDLLVSRLMLLEVRVKLEDICIGATLSTLHPYFPTKQTPAPDHAVAKHSPPQYDNVCATGTLPTLQRSP
jgi:hypothetical protein